MIGVVDVVAVRMIAELLVRCYVQGIGRLVGVKIMRIVVGVVCIHIRRVIRVKIFIIHRGLLITSVGITIVLWLWLDVLCRLNWSRYCVLVMTIIRR